MRAQCGDEVEKLLIITALFEAAAKKIGVSNGGYAATSNPVSQVLW